MPIKGGTLLNEKKNVSQIILRERFDYVRIANTGADNPLKNTIIKPRL